MTRCRPGPGPSRQRLRHRVEALEQGDFRSNIACCWRQRLHRAAVLLLWNVGTSVWLGSHAGASSGVFSFEARHHAEWASTGHHLKLLLLITARGSLAGAPSRPPRQRRLLLRGSASRRTGFARVQLQRRTNASHRAVAVMGDGGDATRCRPGPGPSRQRPRHRAEALECGFRINIARCWRQRLHRAAPLEHGHVWQSYRCLQRRLLLRGSASRRVGFDRAAPRAAPPDHGTRQSCRCPSRPPRQRHLLLRGSA